MTETVTSLIDVFRTLTAKERAEFLSASLNPSGEYGDWSEEDSLIVAAQTFARIDAEEEGNDAEE